MEGKRPGERIESLNPLYTYCVLIWKVYCMVQERDDHLTITIFGACFSVIEGIEQTWWVNGGCILVLLSLAIYVDKQTYVMRSLRTFMGSSWVFISLLETHVLLSFLRWVNFLIICICKISLPFTRVHAELRQDRCIGTYELQCKRSYLPNYGGLPVKVSHRG